ncbi:MAG TPA: hypothetical protein VJ083_05485 [Sedimentibacter sp.]|nr:hypothetical protein [Sedimentibacter sp.]
MTSHKDYLGHKKTGYTGFLFAKDPPTNTTFMTMRLVDESLD